MKTIKAKIIGHGHPKIAILGCVHGDEIMGAKAIRELLKLPIVKGELHFIIANEPAKQKRQRYLKHDLNRAFPGNPDGEAEHYLAHVLKQQLAKMDLVIDLHATNSNFSDLAIITKLGQKEKQLLKLIPNQKVALIRKAVFGGNDLISHTKLGLALEYGPNKTGKNYPQAVRDVKQILINLGIIAGEKTEALEKDLYTVSGIYAVSKKFQPNKKLRNFELIKKGEAVGRESGKIIKSHTTFYPLFLGEGRYQKTLALISAKRKLVLKQTINSAQSSQISQNNPNLIAKLGLKKV